MHVVQGPPGKQPLAEGEYPVEIKENNNIDVSSGKLGPFQ